jgi:hydrogenase maturation protease
MNRRILVACIGNIFLGDDGFGVEMARRLRAEKLPEAVTLVDYGIRGLDLAYALLDPWRAVVLVDAISRGKPPGTVYLLQPGGVRGDRTALDPHSMDPAQVLRMAHSLGEVHANLFIVGCEPQDFGDELHGRMGLSPAVEAALPGAAGMVAELVSRLTQAQGAACIAN